MNPATITATYTSTNLISIFNSTQFENTNSLINIKTSWKPTTSGTTDVVPYSGITGIPTTWSDTQIPTLTITKISGLQGALDAKQGTINSVANQITLVRQNFRFVLGGLSHCSNVPFPA